MQFSPALGYKHLCSQGWCCTLLMVLFSKEWHCTTQEELIIPSLSGQIHAAIRSRAPALTQNKADSAGVYSTCFFLPYHMYTELHVPVCLPISSHTEDVNTNTALLIPAAKSHTTDRRNIQGEAGRWWAIAETRLNLCQAAQCHDHYEFLCTWTYFPQTAWTSPIFSSSLSWGDVRGGGRGY